MGTTDSSLHANHSNRGAHLMIKTALCIVIGN
jgi:hypothetical protein